MEILELYLDKRNGLPHKALKNTRVLALMGMTLESVNMFKTSLSSQTRSPNPIDMYFYSDSILGNIVNNIVGLGLIKLSRYTYPSRIVYRQGTIDQHGLGQILKWMTSFASDGFFMNLKYFEFSEHSLDDSLAEKSGSFYTIHDNLKWICSSTSYFPLIEELRFDGNGLSQESAERLQQNLQWSCDTVRSNIRIVINTASTKTPFFCATSLLSTESNFGYYNMSDTNEVSQCRYTWHWEVGDTSARYSSGPYPKSHAPC